MTKKPSAKTKTMSAAPMMPEAVIGTKTVQKVRVAAGAHAARGEQHALVEAAHGGGDREDGEGNEEMRHADDDAEFVAHQRQRLRR